MSDLIKIVPISPLDAKEKYCLATTFHLKTQPDYYLRRKLDHE
jgi:hypothetical protein